MTDPLLSLIARVVASRILAREGPVVRVADAPRRRAA